MEIEPGTKYGRLTAIEPILKGRYWHFKCDCGKTCKIRKYYVLHHGRKTCGCRIDTYTQEKQIKCNGCGMTKERNQFYLRKKTGTLYQSLCKSCVNKRGVERERRIRIQMINHYGGKCACCGESHREFLAFDHVNGGGNKHRKIDNIRKLHMWLYQQKCPPGFRVLCNNCNFSYGAFGYCPHQQSSDKIPLPAPILS